jgi:hypothetical protein
VAQIDDAKLIAVENASALQLTAAHNFIIANASGWWHHVPHVWLLESSQNAQWWRDQIQPIIAVPPGIAPTPTVLVLELPRKGLGRNWAYYGPNGANEIGWLLSEYQA